MAKFIKVTVDHRKAAGAIEPREHKSIVDIDGIEYAWEFESGTSIMFKTGRELGNIVETPAEIHALIKEAQGPSDLEAEIEDALQEMLADKSPSDILKMMKDGVPTE